jgi:hypothetical protein
MDRRMLWFFFVALVMVSECSVLSDYESETVVDWFMSLSDGDQTVLGWNTSQPICNFTGLACNNDNELIRWATGNIRASIPIFWGSFLNLTYISYDNSVQPTTGTLPTELGNLSRLTQLTLIQTRVGTIPTELGNLEDLTLLVIINCVLTGTIPTELGRLNNVAITLLGSSLSGTIPKEIFSSSLRSLSIYFSQVSGTIPTEVGVSSLMSDLALDTNHLSGTIPTEIGLCTTLTQLDLSNSQLSGTIPTEVNNLVNLDYLALHNNQLSGTISMFPPSVYELDLSENDFYGPILNIDFGNFNNNPEMCLVPGVSYSESLTFDQSNFCVYCASEVVASTTITSTFTATSTTTSTVTSAQPTATITVTVNTAPPPACTDIAHSYVSKTCPGAVATSF